MAEQPARAKRHWLYIPYGIAAIIVIAYFLLWRAGAHEMKKAVGIWAENQRAAGLEVEYKKIRAEGFPFFLRVHVEQPVVTAPDIWSWRADKLSLDALPYDLNRLIFSPVGEQVVYLKEHGEWRIKAADFRASIAKDKARDWVFSVTLGDAHARRADDSATASLKSLIFDFAPDANDKTALVLNLTAREIEAKAETEHASISSLQTVVKMTETDGLYGPDPLDTWRAAGGNVIIRGLVAELEQARLSVSGRVSIDNANHPAGRLKAEIVNPAGFAELLGDAGVLSTLEAQTAAAGLTLAALAGGGKIAAPIDMIDGTAQIVGVKIADLPQIQKTQF